MTACTETRFAPFEFRAAAEGAASPGTLAGVAMPYGARAELAPGLFETFRPGSLKWDAADGVILNWQHDRGQPVARSGEGGGLELTDGPDALRIAAELAATQSGRDVAELARRRVLRGFSVEFRAVRETIEGGNLRVIHEAVLRGIGVVDRPAYDDAVADLRARLDGATRPGPCARRVWL